MLSWLFGHKQEERAAGAYTDALTAYFLALAAGQTSPSHVEETAASEFAVGLLSRAFAVSEMAPEIPGIGQEFRSTLVRTLLIRGNAVYALDVDREGRLTLLPASSYDVRGGPNPASWRYQLDIPGPTAAETLYLPAESVIHCRIGQTATRPWQGISPLAAAGLSSLTLAQLEASLRDETKSKSGTLLPIPEGLPDAVVDGLKRDLSGLKGQVAIVETTSGGLGQGRGQQPLSDWNPKRFGPDIKPGNAQLRRDVANDICAALGVPAGLLTGAGQVRESYRQLLTAGVQPLASLIAEELALKLERRIEFSFRKLQAADIMARARAYGSLVNAQMDAEEAKRLSGLED